MGRVRFRFVPHGGHPTRKMRPIRLYSFNSCPRRRASSPTWELPHISPFQFSPPHGGHQNVRYPCGQYFMFQFSPPHGGHRRLVYAAVIGQIVSILAPARRASGLICRCGCTVVVSILAPARRASRREHRKPMSDYGFNSRPRTEGISRTSASSDPSRRFQFSPPHGGHHCRDDAREPDVDVSILAPARRASRCCPG